MYICTMQNRMFIQIYASTVRVERLALSPQFRYFFPAFAWLFLPHFRLSLSFSVDLSEGEM